MQCIDSDKFCRNLFLKSGCSNSLIGTADEGQKGSTETAGIPFKITTTIRPKMDQADLNPSINESKLQDFDVKTGKTTTNYPTTRPITRGRITPTTMYLQTVFPASNGGAENGTAPTLAPIQVEKIKTTKEPTTKEKGTPLKDYPTVFPGLAYSRKPSGSRTSEAVLATRPTRLQNSDSVTKKVPGKGNRLDGSGSANYYARTTGRPVFQTTNSAVNMLTTSKPTLKYVTQNVNGQQKDEFSYQTTVSQTDGQTNVVVPHQVFNPEQEAQQDQEAEEERQRLLAMTTPAPVTYMRDSDEDVTSPDNQNKDDDNDWHGLRYGPLALPPAFKGHPSRKGLYEEISSHICSPGMSKKMS